MLDALEEYLRGYISLGKPSLTAGVPKEMLLEATVPQALELVAAVRARWSLLRNGFEKPVAESREALEAAGIHFDAVVSIEIADEVIEARMTGRRVCGSCGASFHIVANPPKHDGVCDLCGAPLTVRKDDAPETVQALSLIHI